MRNGFRNVRPLALLASVVLLAFAGFRAEAAPAPKGGFAEHRAGEFVVKFKSGIQAKGLVRSFGTLSTRVTSFKTDDRFAKVIVRTKMTTKEALRQLESSADVEYAEPNYIYRTNVEPPSRGVAKDDWWGGNPGWGGSPGWGNNPVWGDPGSDWNNGGGRTPNDSDFGNLWGMLNTGQSDSSGQAGTTGVDIGATAAWGVGTGSREIIVAVIDTGIDLTHEDLAANAYTNHGEVAGNGVDDDGNGFIDDVQGWNFEANTNNAMDDNRHGTHCSGTIGGVGDNGKGVAGVSWQVSLMPIKFLSAQGSGSLTAAVESIKYATKMHANVMSNSWGGGGYSKAMEDAIKEARDAGILFVAAAGNESNNNDARPTYPAGYQVENVLAVAAIDNKDALASFSNYGARLVHIGAPGVRIWSSVPGNSYESLSGTSMACPHVAGASALLWSLNRGMSYADIKARLIATAEPTRALQRKTVAGGRLNIANAIANRTPTRPGPSDSEWVAMSSDVQSEHNYADNAVQSYEVSVPGARYIRVHFSRVQVEEGYDFIKLVDSTGSEVESLTGEMEDYTSVYGDGERLQIQLHSDSSNPAWGFAVDRVEYVM